MDVRAIGMGVLFGLMWASAFTSAKIVVSQAPPLTALALRFLISGLIGIALARALGQSWRLSRAQWRATVVFGICQNALYLGFYFMAMRRIDASLAAIIASSMPLLVALAGRLVLGERVGPLGAAGLLAGMVGVALIMGARLSGGADPAGVALCVLGVLSLAVATLSVRGASSGGNFLMVVGLQMLIGSAALWGPALLMEPLEVSWSPSLVAAFLYTVLIPGLGATLLWFVLVDRIGAVRAAVFHFLTPFFGVTIAALVLGEALGPWDLVGVVVIALGILAVQLSKRPETSAKGGSAAAEAGTTT